MAKSKQLKFPARLEDIAPTLLHSLGLNIPYEMDGRVLKELLDFATEPHFSHQDIYRHNASLQVPLGDEQYQRLKKLGYLG